MCTYNWIIYYWLGFLLLGILLFLRRRLIQQDTYFCEGGRVVVVVMVDKCMLYIAQCYVKQNIIPHHFTPLKTVAICVASFRVGLFLRKQVVMFCPVKINGWWRWRKMVKVLWLYSARHICTKDMTVPPAKAIARNSSTKRKSVSGWAFHFYCIFLLRFYFSLLNFTIFPVEKKREEIYGAVSLTFNIVIVWLSSWQVHKLSSFTGECIKEKVKMTVVR